MNFSSSQAPAPTDIDSAYILLQIIANPDAAKKRLDVLVKQTDKLEAAANALTGTETLADIRSELESRERMLATRQAAVELLEADVRKRYAAIAAAIS
jgi:hypothetical protein